MVNESLSLLPKLFNKIIGSKKKKMIDGWKIRIEMPIYKNEENIQNCTDYNKIKAYEPYNLPNKKAYEPYYKTLAGRFYAN